MIFCEPDNILKSRTSEILCHCFLLCAVLIYDAH